MPEFRGSKNLHIGADTERGEDGHDVHVPAWAASEWDADGREYVIKLSEADAKKFRDLGKEHTFDFREVGK